MRGLTDAMRIWNDLAFTDGEPETLELVLAPGVYRGAVLTLADTAPVRPVSLVVRGEPGAILVDSALSLAGPRVEVRGLVFKGRRSGFHLEVRADAEIVLNRLAFVDVQGGEAAHGGSSQLGGAIGLQASAPGATVWAEDVWLVRAKHPGRVPLVQVHPGQGHFSKITLTRVAANKLGGSGLLGLYADGSVDLNHCAVVLKGAAPLVSSAMPHGLLRIVGGAYLLDSVDRFLHPIEGFDRMAMEFLPAQVEAARVLVRGDSDEGEPGAILVDCELGGGPRAVARGPWKRGALASESPDADALLGHVAS